MLNSNIPKTLATSAIYANIPSGYALAVGFAENVRRLRLRLDIRQEDLGAMLGVGQGAVSKWETGETQPKVETLPTIAKVLHADLMDLIVGRADSTHEENSIAVTPSVSTAGVQDTRAASTSSGGVIHATSDGTATRRQQSESALDAEVRRRLLELDSRLGLIQDLDQATNTIGRVSDALRSTLGRPRPGKQKPPHAGSHPALPRRAARRSGGRR